MKTYLFKLGFIVALVAFFSINQLRAFTAVTSGDWTNPATWGGVAPGSSVTGQDIIIPTGITVNLNVDVLFNGLLNQFNVEGVLNSSTNNGLTMESGAFSGDGDVDIQRLEFNLLSTSSFTGTLTVNELVDDGGLITFTSDISVTDTLNLMAGTITLNTGANLAVQTNSTVRRDDGSIVIGGGVFNSGSNYHVMYVGSSKTTGVEINSTTIQNVFIQMDDNSQTVTLGSDMQVNGTLQMNMGTLAIGSNELELMGNLNMVAGSQFSGIATSAFSLESSAAINSGIDFTPGSSLEEFSIDHTGTGNVKLMGTVTIVSELELIDGDLSLESGSGVTMGAGSMVHIENGSITGNGGSFTGTASYDVEYMGGTNTTGLEITGSGLNDLEVNLTANGDQINLDDNATVNGYINLRNGKLHLNGYDLVVNGTFHQESDAPIIGNNNSELELAFATTGASDTLYFDGSNQNLEALTLDLSGGDIVMGSVLHIQDELTMNNGRIVLMDHDLVLEQGANITNYSDTRYIVTDWSGKLQQYVELSSPYLVYPVGTDMSYSPASILQGSGATAGNIKVGTFDGVFTGGTEFSGYNSANTGSVVNRTWEIEADGGVTIDMDLKLGWVASSEVNGFDRTNSYISHYMSGNWDSYASASAVAGLHNTYEIERTGVTSLSPFAVADINAEMIVEDEEMAAMVLYPNPCTNVMNVGNTNVADQYVYQVTDMTGRHYNVIANGTNQFDVSDLDAGLYFLRITNNVTQKTTVKEFIKK